MKKIITLIALSLLSACELATGGAGNASKIASPCGLPDYVNVDGRLVEGFEYDSSHCVQGQSCQFNYVNTHERMIPFSLDQSQAPLSDAAISDLETKYGVEITYGNISGYLQNSPTPVNFSNYMIHFSSNADAQAFIDECQIVDPSW